MYPSQAIQPLQCLDPAAAETSVRTSSTCHNKWMMCRIRRRLRQMSRYLGWPVWTWCRLRRPHGTSLSTCLLSGTYLPPQVLHQSCVLPTGQECIDLSVGFQSCVLPTGQECIDLSVVFQSCVLPVGQGCIDLSGCLYDEMQTFTMHATNGKRSEVQKAVDRARWESP